MREIGSSPQDPKRRYFPTPVVVSSRPQKDNSGERIIGYWIQNDKINQANQRRMQAWMDAHGVTVSITFFAHTEMYEQERKQMVADLNLPEVSK